MYDVIVIGAGPAGVSAGIYAKRSGANVLILYYGESNVEKAHQIDNYYGFENGVTGKELFESGIRQAVNLEIAVKKEETLDIISENGNFLVETTSNKYEGKSIIIATSNKQLRPDIEGIKNFEGKGVSYCAICDGFFFRNKNVAVIGSGHYAVKEAEILKNIAKSVTILTDGQVLEENTSFETNSKKIKQIIGENKVSQVLFEDESLVDIDGIFVAIGEAGGVDFARKIGVMLESDFIVVDKEMKTNVEGVFACGNVTGGLLQICKATYEGAIAGLSSVKYVKGL